MYSYIPFLHDGVLRVCDRTGKTALVGVKVPVPIQYPVFTGIPSMKPNSPRSARRRGEAVRQYSHAAFSLGNKS